MPLASGGESNWILINSEFKGYYLTTPGCFYSGTLIVGYHLHSFHKQNLS